MRITLMHNPAAGDTSVGRELVDLLEECSYQVDYHTTHGDDLDEPLQDPGVFVLVAGGDGTVRKIATRLINRDVPLGILPLGTANNISSSLGISASVEEIISDLSSFDRRAFDIGVLQSNHETHYFLEAAGGGLFANMLCWLRAARRSAVSQTHGRTLTTEAIALSRDLLREMEPTPWEIELDGSDCSDEYLLVEAMNIPTIGANLSLAPEAVPDDGRFDFVFVTEEERNRFVDYLTARVKGDTPPCQLPVRRVQTATIHRPESQAVHVDGLIWPPSSRIRCDQMSPAAETLDIRMLPHALTFLTPQEVANAPDRPPDA